MPVAEKFNCSWGAVERSLRDAVIHVWISRYDMLCRITGTKLKSPPTPADMLDIIAIHVKCQNGVNCQYQVNSPYDDNPACPYDYCSGYVKE